MIIVKIMKVKIIELMYRATIDEVLYYVSLTQVNK